MNKEQKNKAGILCVITLFLLFSVLSHGSDDDLSSSSLNNFIRTVGLADSALLYGDVDAMKIMGARLEKAGFPAASFKYWLKAAKKGDEEARLQLQRLYDQGIGTSSERMGAAVHLGFRRCLARLFRR